MFVASSYGKTTEEREQWAREEKEWTMRRKEKEEDAKLRERRGRMATGSLVLGVVGRNLLVKRGGGNHDCNHSSGDGKGGSTDKKLAVCPM
jgi:hypothetical protein